MDEISTRLLRAYRGGLLNRRTFLQAAAALGAGAMLPACKKESKSPPAVGAAAPAPPEPVVQMAQFPEKTNLILLTDRPPQLETPLEYFRHDLTPNDAFFVRWHLSMIPTKVDLNEFRLNIGGHVDNELTLSVDDLRKQFDPFSIVAVNQCSGNSRSFFGPRVFGGQWGNGAMGNAKWTGIRLRDLLQKAKVKDLAVDVGFAGLDKAPLPTTPSFAKSLAFDHAMDGEVMVAYEMNDAPLPMLNGFPLRLIVPGWFGTYWVKALTQITVLPEKFKNFWMDKAYRIPNNPQINESPTALDKDTVPISRMLVRSLFVRPGPEEHIFAGKEYPVEGLAFDGGSGIKMVEVSADGGTNWYAANLDGDLGKYSWRRWRFGWTPKSSGTYKLMVRATSNTGETQQTSQWNRSGYARNIIEQLSVTVG